MNFTDRQNQIIDTALGLIAEGGMENFTMKNLANIIEISEPAIYRHFESKSEIVKAIISRFDLEVPTENSKLHGFDALAAFAMGRFRQVEANPHLARVMFSEEIFAYDAEFTRLMMDMMHRHKASLEKCFAEGVKNGEIDADIPTDILFRLFFGPIRMLVKQWGMTSGAFDLVGKGDELLSALRKILRPR